MSVKPLMSMGKREGMREIEDGGKEAIEWKLLGQREKDIKAVTTWVTSAFPPHLWSMESFQLQPRGEAGIQQGCKSISKIARTHSCCKYIDVLRKGPETEVASIWEVPVITALYFHAQCWTFIDSNLLTANGQVLIDSHRQLQVDITPYRLHSGDME